jgi:hypothetical protein
MAITKKPASPISEDQAKEKKVEELLRNADLKKFDPDLEEETHPPKPAKGE